MRITNEIETLKTEAIKPETKVTTAKRFEKLGLIFDQERSKQGIPCLALLIQPNQTSENTTMQTLGQISLERDLLQNGYGIAGTVMTGGEIFTNPLVAVGGITASGIILKRVEKVSRILRVGTAILDAFEFQGVELYPRLEVPGHNPLDLFVRFPLLALLLISLRSMRGAEIVFKEENETLYAKRKGKGSKKWLPDPLLELSDYQSWLKANRQQFGISSKEVRKPLAKVLVLCGETKLDEHKEHGK